MCHFQNSVTLRTGREKGQGLPGKWGCEKVVCRMARGRGPQEVRKNKGRGPCGRESSGKQTLGMGERSMAGRSGRKAPEFGYSYVADRAERPQRRGHGTPLSHKGEWHPAQRPWREGSILWWRQAAEGPQSRAEDQSQATWNSDQWHSSTEQWQQRGHTQKETSQGHRGEWLEWWQALPRRAQIQVRQSRGAKGWQPAGGCPNNTVAEQQGAGGPADPR